MTTKPSGFTPVVRAGDLLFLSGQVAIEPETMTILGDDVAEQARHCLDRIAAILETEGASLEDVVRVECFLADRGDFAAWNAVFSEYFPSGPPARSTLICELVVPGLLIEVQATAHAPNVRGTE